MKINENALSGRHFFPNLVGLRFWLALSVTLRHIEEVKFMRHIQHDRESIAKFHTFGQYPMLMFFVLSGFLITYQLEIEKRKSGTISIKRFYKNRAFRILPLYYLSLIIYWVVLPYSPIGDYYNSIYFQPWYSDVIPLFEISKWLIFILCIVLLPHLGHIILLNNNRAWMYGVQHWSIGVEEIFYIVWPLLWKKITSFKNFIIKCFIGYYSLLFGSLFLFFLLKKLFHSPYLNFVSFSTFYFFNMSAMYCFFIGAIGIYLYLYRLDLLNKYINIKLFYISLFTILFFTLGDIEFPFIISEIVCSCYMICILYILKTGKKYLIFEHPLIVYLGKITYPVYLVHFGAITFVMYFLEKFGLHEKNIVLFNILLYVGTLVVTFSVSALLYEFYEKKFLAMR